MFQTERKNLVSIVCSGIAAIFFLGLLAGYFAPNVFAGDKTAMITIKDDMTAREIGDDLASRDLISNAMWFRIAASLSGNASQIKKGTYTVQHSMSMQALLAKLTSGKSEAGRLVVPEGYTVQQIAQELEKMKIVDAADFLEAAKKSDNLKDYMKGNRQVTFPVEGFLFPDTYFIPDDATSEDILKLMLDGFDRKLTPQLRQKIADRNMSIYQFMTLASLVEKEAKFDEDRMPIAAVFYKRLQIDMPLQSDATISYAMGTYKAAYSIQETKYDSPYNTYQHAGLPPGPICNPGMECISAAADAPATDYLYFVADAQGHNHFSTTYEEHLKNVEEYQ